MRIRVVALVLIGVLVSSTLIGLISSANAALNSVTTPALATATTIDKGTITLIPPISSSPGAWSVLITDTRIATADGLTVTLRGIGSTVIRYIQAASGEFKSISNFSRLTVTAGIPVLGGFPDRTATLSQNLIALTPPTSNSDGSWSYESLNTDIATIAGNTVALRDGGVVQIRAIQSATARWLSSSKTMTLTINAPTPVLGSFSDITLSIDSVSRVQLTMPRSNSTGAWTLTSSDPTIVGLDGLTLLTLRAGSATITARQAPAGGFRSTNTSMKVTVSAVTPETTIGAFQDFAIDLNIGATQVVTFISPTSTSPAPWSFTSSDSTIATVNGLNLIALKQGTITLSANQPALGNFAAVGPISIKVTIRGNQQLVKPTSITKLVGDPAVKIEFPVSLSSGVWSATSNAPAIAAISNGNLAFESAGTAVITLTQSATESFTSSSTTFEVTVIGTPPVLGIFESLNVGIGEKTTTIITPQSPSTGRWVITSSDPTIASIDGSVITGVKAGTAIISAYQEPAGRYGQSRTVQSTITVKAAPSIITPVEITIVIGTEQMIINPTSNSLGSWGYSSGNPAITTISGSTVTGVSIGTTTITGTQNLTESYTSGSTTFSVTVIGAEPALGLFETLTVDIGEKLTTPVTPQSPSTGRWIFTSADPTIASIVDNVITGIKAGTTTISAFQEPAGRYGQSQTVQTTITVKPAPTITTPANIALVAGAQQVITNPTSNSLGTWSYTSSNPAIAAITGSSISGSSISALAAGTATITANQLATTTFTAASRTFTITVTAAPVPRATAIPTKRVITVTLTNAAGKRVIVRINGVISRVGKNTVKPGRNFVTVQVDGRLILNKVITIR